MLKIWPPQAKGSLSSNNFKWTISVTEAKQIKLRMQDLNALKTGILKDMIKGICQLRKCIIKSSKLTNSFNKSNN